MAQSALPRGIGIFAPAWAATATTAIAACGQPPESAEFPGVAGMSPVSMQLATGTLRMELAALAELEAATEMAVAAAENGVRLLDAQASQPGPPPISGTTLNPEQVAALALLPPVLAEEARRSLMMHAALSPPRGLSSPGVAVDVNKAAAAVAADAAISAFKADAHAGAARSALAHGRDIADRDDISDRDLVAAPAATVKASLEGMAEAMDVKVMEAVREAVAKVNAAMPLPLPMPPTPAMPPPPAMPLPLPMPPPPTMPTAAFASASPNTSKSAGATASSAIGIAVHAAAAASEIDPEIDHAQLSIVSAAPRPVKSPAKSASKCAHTRRKSSSPERPSACNASGCHASACSSSPERPGAARATEAGHSPPLVSTLGIRLHPNEPSLHAKLARHEAARQYEVPSCTPRINSASAKLRRHMPIEDVLLGKGKQWQQKREKQAANLQREAEILAAAATNAIRLSHDTEVLAKRYGERVGLPTAVDRLLAVKKPVLTTASSGTSAANATTARARGSSAGYRTCSCAAGATAASGDWWEEGGAAAAAASAAAAARGGGGVLAVAERSAAWAQMKERRRQALMKRDALERCTAQPSSNGTAYLASVGGGSALAFIARNAAWQATREGRLQAARQAQVLAEVASVPGVPTVRARSATIDNAREGEPTYMAPCPSQSFGVNLPHHHFLGALDKFSGNQQSLSDPCEPALPEWAAFGGHTVGCSIAVPDTFTGRATAAASQIHVRRDFSLQTRGHAPPFVKSPPGAAV